MGALKDAMHLALLAATTERTLVNKLRSMIEKEERMWQLVVEKMAELKLTEQQLLDTEFAAYNTLYAASKRCAGLAKDARAAVMSAAVRAERAAPVAHARDEHGLFAQVAAWHASVAQAAVDDPDPRGQAYPDDSPAPPKRRPDGTPAHPLLSPLSRTSTEAGSSSVNLAPSPVRGRGRGGRGAGRGGRAGAHAGLRPFPRDQLAADPVDRRVSARPRKARAVYSPGNSEVSE